MYVQIVYVQIEPDDINIADRFKFVTGRDRRNKTNKNIARTAPVSNSFETKNPFCSLRFTRNNDCIDKEEMDTGESSDDEPAQSYQVPLRSVSTRKEKYRSRPELVVSKYPERGTTKPVRPGNKNSYSEAVTEGKCVMVFSTSMTKGIRVREFNKRLKNGTARFRRFHGGRVMHMFNYVDTHLG